MSSPRRRLLLAGETWVTYGIHQKGFGAYTTGAYEEGQREFVAALEAAGWEVVHVPNHLATEELPWTAADYAEFDVVVLSDIGADTLLLHPDAFVRGRRKPNRLLELSRWVEEGGGGFAMIGGYLSFSGFDGKGGYHGTALERALGVRMLGYDDRVEAPQGVVPSVRAGEHPVLAGVPTEWPWFLGYNRLVADGGEVLITVDEDPFLIVSERGDGRTAAFASDCSPHWGSPEFLEWSGYRPFWDGLFTWLAGGERS